MYFLNGSPNLFTMKRTEELLISIHRLFLLIGGVRGKQQVMEREIERERRERERERERERGEREKVRESEHIRR